MNNQIVESKLRLLTVYGYSVESVLGLLVLGIEMLQSILDKAKVDLLKDNLKLEIKQTDNQVLSKLANKITAYTQKVTAQESFESKSDQLSKLMQFLLEFQEENKDNIQVDLAEDIEYLYLESCLYTELYRGLYWISQVNRLKEQGSNKNLYLGALYTAVDFFEGGLYRAMQMQVSSKFVLDKDLKDLLSDVFREALKEIEEIPEERDSHNNVVAIRRTSLAGIKQLEWLEEWYRENPAKANQSALKTLARWIKEDELKEETPESRKSFEDFQEIVDSYRLPGQKVFSQE